MSQPRRQTLMGSLGAVNPNCVNPRSCSMKTKVRTVCGLLFYQHTCPVHGFSCDRVRFKPRGMGWGDLRQPQPGGHPALHEETGAFFLEACADYLEDRLHARTPGQVLTLQDLRRRMGAAKLTLAAEALWILLLSTSAGAQIVVATVPATREERKWVRMSSARPAVERRYCFAAEYLHPF